MAGQVAPQQQGGGGSTKAKQQQSNGTMQEMVRSVYLALRRQGFTGHALEQQIAHAMRKLMADGHISRLPSYDEATEGTNKAEMDFRQLSAAGSASGAPALTRPTTAGGRPQQQPHQQQNIQQQAVAKTQMTSTTYMRDQSASQMLKNVKFNRPDFPTIDPDEVRRKGVVTELRPHQLQFVEFVRKRHQSNVRSIGLFDEMGLGKTLSALAVCQVLHPEPTSDVGGTLVVTPKTLMKQWKQEIEAHVRNGAHPRRVHLWYGAQREQNIGLLTQYDYVITTYEVVRSAIQGNNRNRQQQQDEEELDEQDSAAKDCPLVQIVWHRIILDECHNVRNRNIQSMRALCKLSSHYKMALSGTPIHNSLSDLFSLLRWFKWDEYELSQPDNRSGEKRAKEAWHNYIVKPMGLAGGRASSEEREQAFNRLNHLMDQFVMRRTKQDRVDGESVMGVPPIQYEDVKATLYETEQILYDRLHKQAQDVFEQHNVSASAFRSGYMIILVRILRLRQACCHPSLVGIDQVTCDSCGGGQSDDLMQNVQCGHALCSSCREDAAAQAHAIAASQARKEREKQQQLLQQQTSSEQQLQDKQEQQQQQQQEAECPAPSCDASFREERLTVLADTTEELSELKQKTEKEAAAWGGSSKLYMLKERLDPIVEKGEKALVFSQWPSFLDLCQERLEEDGIFCARLDGKMSTEQRDASVRAFKETKHTNVFLLSLKAGGVGLNLVEANHVFLTDVWWNPQTEQQAFERCHRLGQKKQVKVYRLLIRDSVEEQICKLQEKKRRVANAALEGDVSKLKDLDQEDINLLLSSSQGSCSKLSQSTSASRISKSSGGSRGTSVAVGGRGNCGARGSGGRGLPGSAGARPAATGTPGGPSAGSRATNVGTAEHPDFADDFDDIDDNEEEEDVLYQRNEPPDLFQRFHKQPKTEYGETPSSAHNAYRENGRADGMQTTQQQQQTMEEREVDDDALADICASDDDDDDEENDDEVDEDSPDRRGGQVEELGPEDDDNELLQYVHPRTCAASTPSALQPKQSSGVPKLLHASGNDTVAGSKQLSTEEQQRSEDVITDADLDSILG